MKQIKYFIAACAVALFFTGCEWKMDWSGDPYGSVKNIGAWGLKAHVNDTLPAAKVSNTTSQTQEKQIK